VNSSQGNNTSSQNKLAGAGSYAKTMLNLWPRQRFELLPIVADCDGTPGNGKIGFRQNRDLDTTHFGHQ
jgi:hypothetical protein